MVACGLGTAGVSTTSGVGGASAVLGVSGFDTSYQPALVDSNTVRTCDLYSESCAEPQLTTASVLRIVTRIVLGELAEIVATWDLISGVMPASACSMAVLVISSGERWTMGRSLGFGADHEGDTVGVQQIPAAVGFSASPRVTVR